MTYAPVAPLDLTRADDARTRQQDVPLHRGVGLDEMRIFRPWPDQAHLPAQHVEELRQLIELGPPQVLANPGDPRIALRRQARSHHVGPVDHRAKLVDPEERAVPTGTALTEEDGTG